MTEPRLQRSGLILRAMQYFKSICQRCTIRKLSDCVTDMSMYT
jgi:hypothetical protein